MAGGTEDLTGGSIAWPRAALFRSLVVTALFLITLGSSVLSTGSAGVAAQAAPGGFVGDSFSEASAVAQTSHVGELGAAWTRHPVWPHGASSVGPPGRAYATNASTSLLYAGGVPASADYDVSASLYVASRQGSAGVLGRVDPAVSAMLVELVKDGLVTISMSPEHKRKRIVALSAKGYETAMAARQILDQHFAKLMEAASVDGEQYARLTEQIYQTLIAKIGQT